MQFVHWLQKPWPWYIAGPLIGLMVPALLIMGNKSFGISSSLRHIIAALGRSDKSAHRGKPPVTGLRPEPHGRSLFAACMPARIPFFQYDWKKERWNLFFVGGIIAGGALAASLLADPSPVRVNPSLVAELGRYGINDYHHLLPTDLFNWKALLTLKGLILTVAGGFLVGFGTRYAGGCTSGHAITGLSNLQMPSLIATCSFMAGGFIMANWLLPAILQFN
ncbi:MAG: YeeE/YedE thiosulfate transporter family protein [Puia sp.]|nr:YeeE/YedE thiosulfate transporter family protein [Puia sp.]